MELTRLNPGVHLPVAASGRKENTLERDTFVQLAHRHGYELSEVTQAEALRGMQAAILGPDQKVMTGVIEPTGVPGEIRLGPEGQPMQLEDVMVAVVPPEKPVQLPPSQAELQARERFETLASRMGYQRLDGKVTIERLHGREAAVMVPTSTGGFETVVGQASPGEPGQVSVGNRTLSLDDVRGAAVKLFPDEVRQRDLESWLKTHTPEKGFERLDPRADLVDRLGEKVTVLAHYADHGAAAVVGPLLQQSPDGAITVLSSLVGPVTIQASELVALASYQK